MKLVVAFVDGLGMRFSSRNNLLYESASTFVRSLMKVYPTAKIEASGQIVGLAKGIASAESSMMTISSGRAIAHPVTSLNFDTNKSFAKAIGYAKRNKSTVHVITLLSNAGVQSYLTHLLEVAARCNKRGLKCVAHFIVDDVDTVSEPLVYYEKVAPLLSKLGCTVGTVTSRKFAMNTHEKWDFTELTYNAMSLGHGVLSQSVTQSIAKTDVHPTVIRDYSGMSAKDVVMFLPCRGDGMQQLVRSFSETKFEGFKRRRKNLYVCCAIPYYRPLKTHVFQDYPVLKNTVVKEISKKRLKQFRICEDKKRRMVTLALDLYEQFSLNKEERVVVESKGSNSMRAITRETLHALRKEKADVVFSHYSPIGYGSKGVNVLNECLRVLHDELQKDNVNLLIVGTHGGLEDTTRAFTDNKVAMILVGPHDKIKNGSMVDVGATILDLLDLKIPKDFVGKSLLIK